MTKRRRRHGSGSGGIFSRLFRWQYLKWLFAAGLVATLLLIPYVIYLDQIIRTQFEGKRWAIPAKVYARPLELFPEAPLSAYQLEQELKVLAYRNMENPNIPGSYRRQGNRFLLVSREFQFWDGKEESRQILVEFAGDRVDSISDVLSNSSVPLVRLDPGVIGRIYPSHTEDRILVKLDEVPPLLIDALMAIEDRTFYEHSGVSPRSIARAMWANLRAGGTVQGGSTLTQQLVKNFFLSNERTLWRKLNEAIMSLLLEYHYEKNEILEAYLNEIYLGQDGKRAIHGFGLASQFYFEKPLSKLSIEQISLLVAMVKGASYYSPRRHPQRATERRNLVVEVLEDMGEISKGESLAAQTADLGVTPRAKSSVTSYPAFMDLVRRQLRQDYKEEDLSSEGLQIFTTLDPHIQESSEKAMERRLTILDKATGRFADDEEKLQGSMIVTSIENGEVLAMIGDRNPRFAGFNRALDAQRHIGSLVKPAIYLTALQQPEKYTLASLLEDTPLEVALDTGDVWQPQNFDERFHGQIPLYKSLAHSYNVSTARLGMALGLPAVIENLKKLGVQRDLNPYPSLLLGAISLSPFEVTQMYHTYASGGFRTPLRAIREVLTADGQPLQRYPLAMQQVFDSSHVYLITHALRYAARNGTGRSVYRFVNEDWQISSKTGTSNDLRDSWFAAYAGDKLGVVWIGLDSNETTRLTGASGALSVWGQAFQRVSLPPPLDIDPPGIQWLEFDCGVSVRFPFLEGSVPREVSCGEELQPPPEEAAGTESESQPETNSRRRTIKRFFR